MQRDNDYFSYTEDNSVNTAANQCRFCVYASGGAKCEKYPDYKPLGVLNNETLCRYIKFLSGREA